MSRCVPTHFKNIFLVFHGNIEMERDRERERERERKRDGKL